MKTNLYVELSSPLKGFESPNTFSKVQRMISPGSYQVFELKENHPHTDTDYARIFIPAFYDEEIWICTRWKNIKYTSFINKPLERGYDWDVETDQMIIDENFLTDLLPHFYNFEYDLHQAKYPFELSGFKAPLAPPNTNNCCTFVEALIVKAWENAIPGFSWSMKNHEMMMIYSTEDYYSPVNCLVQANIAISVNDPDQAPHSWTLVQGWRRQWSGGHTFIIVDHEPVTDRVLTLESNPAYKLNGVGYRMIGKIRDVHKPPKKWWENESLWTWQKIKSSYEYRKQCVLKIKNTTWSSLTSKSKS